VIDRNGDIYQMVTDGERAHHCRGANASSIVIEHIATMQEPMAKAQGEASAKLIRWLLQQYDIAPIQVYGHDFAPGFTGIGGTSCPDALFGGHSQQAVQDWVNANVLADSSPPTLVTEPPPPPGSQLKVKASALNVRMTPALDGVLIGSLSEGTVVDWLETSADRAWAKIQNGVLTGWSSRRFLLPAMGPADTKDAIGTILDIAATSAIARYHWVARGVAPIGYIKGMALVYARLYGKLKAGDPIVAEMAKADTGNGAKDALSHYSDRFSQAGMDNEASGVSTLRHLIVLMTGLGMMESSGRYCEGRDVAATNIGSENAEAGMFQTSYDARSAHGQLTPLFKSWQKLNAADPAAGPINIRAAEIRPECNQLYMRVEQAIEVGNFPQI